MKTLLLCIILLASTALARDAFPPEAELRLFELRTYYAREGKLDALHARFRDHTLALFAKQGMRNVGYWVPAENTGNAIVYVLAYPDRAARDAMWKAFDEDPEWQAVFAASRADGPLVERVESVFLEPTDYAPPLRSGDVAGPGDSLFELRRYEASPGNLERLHERFRSATVGLFAEAGMTNVLYWRLAPGQEGADSVLMYLLAHPDPQAAGDAWAAFGQNPRWEKARKDSEHAAGGPLTTPGGVQRTFLRPTDYSPLR